MSEQKKAPLTTEEREVLVGLLFPDATDVLPIASYEAQYPPRALPADAEVTRFAPSPTGFMHIGGIFSALIDRFVAHRSHGIFFLRLEDTDVKRSIPGAIEMIVDALERFGLTPDEGVMRGEQGEVAYRGSYGPYVQTERLKIYRDFSIHLIRQGWMYPCFCVAEELDLAREEQTVMKVKPGYYGRWAKWRDASLVEIRERLSQGAPFVLRLRVPEDVSGRVTWEDGAKGTMSMPVNDLDVVLVKSDGIPVYHFAHVVDDHLMRTTHVIRGDEWLASVPLHVQLFALFGYAPLTYTHYSPIQKMETVEETDEKTGEKRTKEIRRKLSKRKDAEANVEFYRELGVPELATIEYLLNIANSAFEDWRKANPLALYLDFPLRLDKFAANGALTDMVKLRSISQAVIARMHLEEIYGKGLAWADVYDAPLAKLMKTYVGLTMHALNIERGSVGGNKRLVTWRDLPSQLAFFYDEVYQKISFFDFPEQISEGDRQKLLRAVLDGYRPEDNRDAWFAGLKLIAAAQGFAPEVKIFKADPSAYRGHIGDVAMILRVALCGTRNSPDLYEVMQVLGEEKVRERLQRFLS